MNKVLHSRLQSNSAASCSRQGHRSACLYSVQPGLVRPRQVSALHTLVRWYQALFISASPGMVKKLIGLTGVCASMQALSGRGKLQIVAGERQSSNVTTKRRLTGGPGLPPIDGNVSKSMQLVLGCLLAAWWHMHLHIVASAHKPGCFSQTVESRMLCFTLSLRCSS